MKRITYIALVALSLFSCTNVDSTKNTDTEQSVDSTIVDTPQTIVIGGETYTIIDSFVVINEQGGVDMYYTYE